MSVCAPDREDLLSTSPSDEPVAGPQCPQCISSALLAGTPVSSSNLRDASCPLTHIVISSIERLESNQEPGCSSWNHLLEVGLTSVTVSSALVTPALGWRKLPTHSLSCFVFSTILFN
jgi:hypothetical protein